MGEYMRATTVAILWVVTFASTVTALPPTTRPTTAETTKPSRTVVAVVNGQEGELPDNQQENAASLIVELLESCSVDRTGDSDAHGDRWKHYANATHLLVKFDPPQHVQFGSSGIGAMDADAILVPISSTKVPGEILVRDGEHFHSLAKYDYKPAKALQQIMKNIQGH